MLDCRFTTLDPDREAEFLVFLAARDLKTPVETHYRWLYQDNPHGSALTVLALAGATGRIVGCNSLFPRKLRVGKEVITGAMGGDTLVDPGWRGRGLATRLHRETLGRMRDAGIEVEYGCPNPPNLRAFVKAGCTIPGSFRRWRLLLETRPLTAKLRLPDLLSRLLGRLGDPLIERFVDRKLRRSSGHAGTIVPVTRFDARFDRLAAGSPIPTLVSAVRDRDYLDWRYFQNPAKSHRVIALERDSELVGFAAFELVEERCYLFDLVAGADPGDVRSLLAAVVLQARHNGSTFISYLGNPRGAYAGVLSRWGFRQGLEKIPFEVLLPEDSRFHAELTALDSWHYTFGDFDLETIG